MNRCPYCYYEVDPKLPIFVCSGRSAPGRNPCKPEAPAPDARRRMLTGFNEPYRVAYMSVKKSKLSRQRGGCPKCGSPPTIRVCPHCETPLNPDFFEGKHPMVGLIGSKYSGKSVYLGVLYQELRHRTAARFSASVTFATDSAGAGELRASSAEMYRPEGSLPPSTPAGAGSRHGRQPIVFNWVQQDAQGHRQSALLSFYDTAGEDLQEVTSVQDQEYLAAANSLIVLIDPMQLPANRDLARQKLAALGDAAEAALAHDAEEVLGRVTDHLRQSLGIKSSQKINVPLAVAFSKIDVFLPLLPPEHPLRQPPPAGAFYDEADGASLHEHLRGMLHEWGGGPLLNLLELNYTRFRLFGVSALGAEPDYKQTKVDALGIRPFRIAEPILWLLGEEGVIRREPRH